MDAPAAEFAVADVSVQRGVGNVTPWARYSNRMGSPVGDTIGGVFRFTCRLEDVSCKVSVSAAFLSNVPGANALMYPRVLIQRQDLNGGPQNTCEYGDSTGGPGGAAVVAAQVPSASPTFSPMTMHIGGSADCGGPDPTFGQVSQITVGPGYYDVFSTFFFLKQ